MGVVPKFKCTHHQCRWCHPQFLAETEPALKKQQKKHPLSSRNFNVRLLNQITVSLSSMMALSREYFSCKYILQVNIKPQLCSRNVQQNNRSLPSPPLPSLSQTPPHTHTHTHTRTHSRTGSIPVYVNRYAGLGMKKKRSIQTLDFLDFIYFVHPARQARVTVSDSVSLSLWV